MKHICKRSLFLLLILCAVVFTIAACTPDSTGTPAETTGASAETTVPAETTAADTTPETEPETTAPNYLELPFAPEAGALSICGVSIEEYCIVIPETCDLYTLYAAKNLASYLRTNAGITMNIVTDDVAEVAYELVIGGTNRDGSARASAVDLEADEYIIMMDDTSVIFWGESYMVGGGAGVFVTRYAAGAWRGYDINITTIPTEPTPETFVFEEANNAILLIGDGMGENQVNMALANGLDSFVARDMPTISKIVTKSQSVINGQADATDSAAAGTALSTGYKTINGYVGVDANQDVLLNVRELAHATGAKTAIMSTDAITGATPSAFLGHVNDRNKTDELSANVSTLRSEGAVDTAKGAMTDKNFLPHSMSALQSVSKKGSTFFVMIEEGYIDKYAHNNDASGVIHTVTRLNSLVAYCMEFVLFHPDTVLIVTADHETGGIQYSEEAGGYVFTSGGHTNVDVPLYAMGYGTEYFTEVRDNTRVPTFIAALYSDEPFGDPTYE